MFKKEVTHKATQKVTHPESISKMIHILGILTVLKASHNQHTTSNGLKTYYSIG